MSGPRFGVFLSPHVEELPQLTEKAQAAESAGFDYVSIQDHQASRARPHRRRRP